jgi:uncharacterized RDD family membrane protein YckC
MHAPAREVPPVVPIAAREREGQRTPRQQSLFRVIPFEAIATQRKVEGKESGGDSGEGQPPAGPRRGGRRPAHPNQGGLFFPPPPPPSPPGGTPPPPPSAPVVQCRAPVAPIGGRAAAAAVDAAIVLGGWLLFLGIHRFWAGELVLDRAGALTYGAAYLMLFAFYKLLAALRSDRSLGLRLLGLRILHFDGRPPSRRQRVLRVLASSGSVLPAGIGLFWALMDEERLTFHDHISETFITTDDTDR